MKKEEDGEKWEREKREREERDREVTRKKREKRERAKNKKKGGKGERVTNGGGIKPRVQIRNTEGLGGEGQEKEVEGSELKAVEEVGVIIHDDD